MQVKLSQITLALSLAVICSSSSSSFAVSNGMESRMFDQSEHNAIADFTRPWSERRGIETTNRNASVVLVKVPLDVLSNALAKRALEERRNVLGSEIEVSGVFKFTFQLVGHPWSILINDGVIEPRRLAASPPPKPAQLSKELKSPVIQLIMSDTTGVIEYTLFEDGEVVEFFSGSYSDEYGTNQYGLKPQRYVLYLSPDDLEAKQIVYFWSRRRQVTADEIGDMWDFANQFLVDHDAFDPGIDAQYLLGSSVKRGDRYQVENPGFVLAIGDEEQIMSGSEQVTSVAFDSEIDSNFENLGGVQASGSTRKVISKKQVISIPDLVRVDYFRFGD